MESSQSRPQRRENDAEANEPYQDRSRDISYLVNEGEGLAVYWDICEGFSLGGL